MAVTKRLANGCSFADRFRIVRPIGSGSMGTVYLAALCPAFAASESDLGPATQELASHVALKVLDPDTLEDPRAWARFDREASSSGRIDDDHVVQVLDSGVDDSTGLAWLAMEWLRGRSLAALLDDRSPPTRGELGSILRQLFEVMARAHQAGVVHRDLKPENVFVVPDPSGRPGPFVKVLDFGIAKVLRPSVTSATTEGLGTPLWVAPEQARSGQVPGPQADVFALALLSFRVLTGKLYWRAANDPGGSVADLAVEILRGPTSPASERAAELGREACLPAGFDGWFARAVEPEPERRFADAGAAWLCLEPQLVRAHLVAAAPVGEPGRSAGGTEAEAPTRRGGWVARVVGWLTGRAPASARAAAAAGLLAVSWGCAGSGNAAVPAALDAAERALVARGEGAMTIVESPPAAPDPSSVLRARAEPLDPSDPALARLVARMRATLDDSGGVGLAAPQIGVSRRLILVRHGTRPAGQPTRVEVYVNPRIEWASDQIDEDYEACLSIPGVGGLVPRARQLRLRFQRPGKVAEQTVELAEWDARIVQHEMDHLDGVLYVDRLRGPLLSAAETKRLRDAAHRRRGWLPPLETSADDAPTR